MGVYPPPLQLSNLNKSTNLLFCVPQKKDLLLMNPLELNGRWNDGTLEKKVKKSFLNCPALYPPPLLMARPLRKELFLLRLPLLFLCSIFQTDSCLDDYASPTSNEITVSGVSNSLILRYTEICYSHNTIN